MQDLSLCAYTVTIAYLSGGDVYASQIHEIDAYSSEDATLVALWLSCGRSYSDPRIPDRSIAIHTRPSDRRPSHHSDCGL